MAENLNLNVNVNTSGAEGSIGSLKKQLREAQNEVVALSDKFGATSREAVNAAKKAAELRDRIGDARALTDAFNPDQKFRALTQSLAGVAGGFAAVQGAMGLFGAESENLQKTLVKVQSAMALSQGIEAVGNSIDAFKNLGTVIRTQVVTAFSTLRGAIIATGVGALAVGIGLLVANWDKVVESFKKSFPVLFTIADKFGAIVTKITDFVGITSKAKREQDDLAKKLNNTNRELENQIKVLEAQGGSENKIYEKRKELIENSLKLIVKGSKDEKEQREKLLTDLKILDINEQKRKQQIIEEQKEEIEKYNEWLLNQELIAFEKRKEQGKKLNKETIGPDGLTDSERKKKAEDDLAYKEYFEKKNKENLEQSEKDGLGRLLSIKTEGYLKQWALDDLNTQKQKNNEKAVLDNKIQSAYIMMDILGSLSSLVGETTAAGKGLALTQIGIDTALAISALVKNSEQNPLNAWTFGSAGLTQFLVGISRITANIVSAKRVLSSNGSTMPSTGGAAMPSMSTQAPMTPQAPTAQVTQLNQQTINDIGNQAVRAYVVESDVTSSQQRMASIKQRARFS
jgi:hypothetical protein